MAAPPATIICPWGRRAKDFSKTPPNASERRYIGYKMATLDKPMLKQFLRDLKLNNSNGGPSKWRKKYVENGIFQDGRGQPPKKKRKLLSSSSRMFRSTKVVVTEKCSRLFESDNYVMLNI